MVRSIVILTLVTTFSIGNGAAQDSGFGLGIILGEPTGISFKNWIGSSTAIDGGVAWAFHDNNSLHLHADYLIHDFNIFKVEKGRLALYYGIGGRVKTKGESRVGIRIPVGLNYIFEKAPLDIFFEIVPLLDLAPSTEFGFNGGIGIRYYF